MPTQAPPAVAFELVTNGYVPKSISSNVPCAPSKRMFRPSRIARFSRITVSAMNGRNLRPALQILIIDLRKAQRLRPERLEDLVVFPNLSTQFLGETVQAKADR